jgi:ribonuclease P/MRP protein subunit POP1
MGKDVITKDINLTKFLDARSSELAYFEEKVRTKFMTINRTPMQSVPKHMRRRAMSHNRFRIPSRLRAIHDKIMKGNEKKKLRCRKHMRNSKLLLLHYFKRSLMQNPGLEVGLKNSALDCKEFVANNLGKKKWLETHLWHARRMKMEVYRGYKIAIKSYQKQIKAVFLE